MIYDTIIVGGGSAGSVLANRLTARSAHQVLLLEAGPDTPPGKVPEVILDAYPGVAYVDERFHWTELKVSTEVVSHNDPAASASVKRRKYEQGRVLGGGSSINGQLANRGSPRDYDEWEKRGAHGWNWESCLPYFRKVERDMDFDGPLHGKEGRIPVSRIWPEQWSPFGRAVGEAWTQSGLKYLPDQNGVFEDGWFPVTISNAYERRVSAAIGYLDQATRNRPNLTLVTETLVHGLIFEDLRCVGIRARVKGQEQEFRANEVILCSGAIHSPTHLLRAGIGPAAQLRDLGIPILANRPGVGQRLMDHPSVAVSCFIKPEARKMAGNSRRHVLAAMRWSSGIGGAPQGDMFGICLNKSAWHAVGSQIGSLLVWVNKTYSETGQVKLSSADARVEPVVEFNLLSDKRDLDRMVDAVRRMCRIYAQPGMQAVSSDPFPAAYSDKVKQVGAVNFKNKFLTGAMAKLMDGPDALRRMLMEKVIMEGYTVAGVMKDDDQAEEFAKKAAVGIWHASCSCRMGADDDPMAVVDSTGRVRGVDGLRVVDSSIMPQVPCANTNFPTLMMAERMADQIIAGV